MTGVHGRDHVANPAIQDPSHPHLEGQTKSYEYRRLNEYHFLVLFDLLVLSASDQSSLDRQPAGLAERTHREVKASPLIGRCCRPIGFPAIACCGRTGKKRWQKSW